MWTGQEDMRRERECVEVLGRGRMGSKGEGGQVLLCVCTCTHTTHIHAHTNTHTHSHTQVTPQWDGCRMCC